MLSRSESQALTRPIRESILQLANYLQNVHGIRPENRSKTDPNEMSVVTLRRWAVLYGVEFRGEGGEFLSDDDLRVACIERQLHPPGHDDDADLDALQEGYDALKARRDEILTDTEDDEIASGPTQTIVPDSISVETLSGLTGLT